ncbi:RhoGAP domain protein [Pelomyxa schiedti]|nr:RhoGAP domain protein [Pelomyxa schiedti]
MFPLEVYISSVAAFKNGKYPIPLAKIVEYLRSVKANTVDGIFRLSAATTSIQRAKEAFDRGEIPVYDDVLTAANLLKLYFMELPDCLLTYELYDSFLEAGRQQNTIVPLLKGLVNKLPRANQYSLAHLLELLAWIAASSDKNKMNSYNLAVVFGPTLLHNKEDNAMMQSSTINFVCQSLIDDYTQIFAGLDTSIPLDPPQIP